MKTFRKINIKVKDSVQILSGQDKGKHGKVLKVDREKGRITIENINVATLHKKKGSGKRGETGIQKVPLPIDISKVKLLCPRCSKATKITRDEVKGKSTRRCRQCNELIDQV